MPRRTNVRKLIRRCRAAVDQLDIPEPFDVGELCRRTGKSRGGPITVAPLSLSGATPVRGAMCASGRARTSPVVDADNVHSAVNKTNVTFINIYGSTYEDLGYLLPGYDFRSGWPGANKADGLAYIAR